MSLGVLILLWLLGALIFWGGLSHLFYRYHPRWNEGESMAMSLVATLVVLAITAIVVATWNYQI